MQHGERAADHHHQAAARPRSPSLTPSTSPNSRLLQAGRRVGRQGEQRAEPEQRSDDDRHRRVAADAGDPRRPARPRPRPRASPAAPPSSSGSPRSAATHQAREQRVGQRLGAVGQVVEDDPAAQRAAGRSQQDHLQQRAAQERARCHGVERRVPDRGAQRARRDGGGGREDGADPCRAATTIVAAVGGLEDRPRQRHGRRAEGDLAPVAGTARGPSARACVDVVGGDQQRAALRGEAAQQVLQPLGARGVEAAERLVEQDHRRVLHERAGDEHALALAAGQIAERASAGSARPTAASASRARAALGTARPPPPRQARRSRPSARRRAR